MNKRKPRVDISPFAITSQGRIFVNVHHVNGGRNPKALLELALAADGAVFIGVSLTGWEVKRVLRAADDALFEAAAVTVGRRG